MKSFKYIAFLLLIVIIGTSIYISVQPNTFKVSRTRTIKAPASVIYSHVVDYKNWKQWWAPLQADPAIKTTLPNQNSGEDTNYTWQHEDGIGTMKTLETEANEFIKQEIQFGEIPPSEVIWSFKQNTNGTTDVTWTITGKDLSFGFKAYTIFTGGVEEQLAADYERSLEKLDAIIVAEMKKYSITVNGITNHSGGYYIYNTSSCKIDDLESKINEMLPKVIKYAQKNRITLAGKPFINYLRWDEANNAVIFTSCVPTTEQVITAEGDAITTGNFNTFKAIKTTLKGNYGHIREAWKTAKASVPESGFEFVENGPMIESYINTPANTPNPANLVTEIYIAIKDSIE